MLPVQKKLRRVKCREQGKRAQRYVLGHQARKTPAPVPPLTRPREGTRRTRFRATVWIVPSTHEEKTMLHPTLRFGSLIRGLFVVSIAVVSTSFVEDNVRPYEEFVRRNFSLALLTSCARDCRHMPTSLLELPNQANKIVCGWLVMHTFRFLPPPDP